MTAQPTMEQLQRTVGVVCKVIGQIPCYHIYEDWIHFIGVLTVLFCTLPCHALDN
jgi:hypothetical protein